jgi:hypothetical protein
MDLHIFYDLEEGASALKSFGIQKVSFSISILHHHYFLNLKSDI